MRARKPARCLRVVLDITDETKWDEKLERRSTLADPTGVSNLISTSCTSIWAQAMVGQDWIPIDQRFRLVKWKG